MNTSYLKIIVYMYVYNIQLVSITINWLSKTGIIFSDFRTSHSKIDANRYVLECYNIAWFIFHKCGLV